MINKKNALEFLESLGSILNIQPETNYIEIIEKESAEEAIAGDWQNVGNDLAVAMKKYDHLTNNNY